MPFEDHVLGGWNTLARAGAVGGRLHANLTRWWTREQLPVEVAAWTDVLIDLRDPRFRKALSSAWETREVFESADPGQGWVLDYQTVPDADGYFGWACYLRFTAPDGFRFTVVFSKGEVGGSTFAVKRAQEAFPSMWRVFQGKRTPVGVRVSYGPRETYDLQALRAAVSDPQAWFGPESSEWRIDSAAIGCLLGWSTIWFPDRVGCERWVRAGLTPATYLSWRETGWEDADIVRLVGPFEPTESKIAAPWLKAGWIAEDAARWVTVLSPGFTVKQCGSALAGLRERGLGPEQTRDLLEMFATGRDAVTRGQRLTGWLRSVMRWLDAVPDPVRVMAYLRAEIPLGEASKMEASAERPDLDALAVLAALAEVPAGSMG